MTATATTTNKEVDRREHPGDGKLNPVNHIVRIVVVRRAGSDAATAESDGPGHEPWSDGKTSCKRLRPS